jgi:CRISPR-associated endoribonuclease Cas6
VQGFLYGNITAELGAFLHDEGFVYGKRRFKMFTFSRLRGEYELRGDRIEFGSPPILLTISSPYGRFMEEFANTLLKKDALELGGHRIYVGSIRVHPEPEIGTEMMVKTLSPVVVYSTVHTKEGKKKTYYYSPYEEEFGDLVDNNLRKKYEAFFGKEVRARKLKLEVVGRPGEKIVKYRGTVIKGWMGRFILKGNKKVLKLGYECGIGAKNSQGFGMVEVVVDEKRGR